MSLPRHRQTGKPGLRLDRRTLLAGCGALALAGPAAAAAPFRRVRPGDPAWPTDAMWAQLKAAVGGQLSAVPSPLVACRTAPTRESCDKLFTQVLKNPYAIGDDPALTQTLGWIDGWSTRPSVYAVAARHTQDVVAAVDFARTHRLRLVIRGGAHSYQGNSNAADSLLVWTHAMREITLHDAFVPAGCAATVAPTRAVSVGAGALWAHVYDAVTTRGGGYVQGGGCMTVGVAGLVQSGGFGSFSKAFGTASGNLLEAEIVTADGRVRVVNACTEPDLFWALKGGGGGSFGVLTRLTLRVHPLPEPFGAVNFVVRARSEAAFRTLAGWMLDLCDQRLLDPHWGEQIRLRPDLSLQVSMVFQGISRGDAQAAWQPLLERVGGASADYSVDFAPFKFISTSARDFWAATFVKKTLGFIRSDDRPGAPDGNVFWPGDQGQAGQLIYGYQSRWLPLELLRDPSQRPRLADALVAASRHAGLSLHLNKGLAGAPEDAVRDARDSALHPAALTAFALLIMAAGGQPAYPGVAGHEPDVAQGRQRAQAIAQGIAQVDALLPRVASYVAESDYFQPDWAQAFWGPNYARLLAVKNAYDPDGLFFGHHGVGSESWSADGFERLA